jgi:hypothetical protein
MNKILHQLPTVSAIGLTMTTTVATTATLHPTAATMDLNSRSMIRHVLYTMDLTSGMSVSVIRMDPTSIIQDQILVAIMDKTVIKMDVPPMMTTTKVAMENPIQVPPMLLTHMIMTTMPSQQSSRTKALNLSL